MDTENHFKAALRDGRKQLGLWLTLGSHSSTELASIAGFDWLLIDMEHTAIDLGDLVGHLRAAQGGSAEPVVRVPWNDTVMIKRVLDQGVRSLLIPFVQNADEARHAVAAVRYPMAGVRGFSGMSRATRYGRDKSYAATANERVCLILQVETPEAVDRAGEIAAVEGVDAVFVGPNDLAANMGLLGQASSAPVQERVTQALQAIKASGKAAGVLDYDPASARRRFEEGFGFIGIGGDTSLLSRAIDALLQQYR